MSTSQITMRGGSRLLAIAALALSLALPTAASAAPPQMGFYECGAGECGISDYAVVRVGDSAAREAGPFAPGFTR